MEKNQYFSGVYKGFVKNYTVRKYQKSDYALWNDFISQAKNATFLFHRDFMEYHEDRFEDYSLMVFDGKKLVAVLPANVMGNTIQSHQGLTYGGLVYSHATKLSKVISVFRELMEYLYFNKIEKVYLKIIPPIYSVGPSDEMEYIMFLVNANLYRRDSLAVIDLSNHLKISKDRKEGLKKGKKNNLKIIETDNFLDFWNEILLPNLKEKHNVKPIHTLEDITLLKSNFPKNIRQFNVYLDNKIVAGTTVFESNNVAHSQYISGNNQKNELGSLDYLHYTLITEVFHNKKYFDFGISNEYQGRKLNQGLSYWKESFGASSVSQNFYEVETVNFDKLDDVMI